MSKKKSKLLRRYRPKYKSTINKAATAKLQVSARYSNLSDLFIIAKNKDYIDYETLVELVKMRNNFTDTRAKLHFYKITGIEIHRDVITGDYFFKDSAHNSIEGPSNKPGYRSIW